jgi:hypothetical protein
VRRREEGGVVTWGQGRLARFFIQNFAEAALTPTDKLKVVGQTSTLIFLSLFLSCFVFLSVLTQTLRLTTHTQAHSMSIPTYFFCEFTVTPAFRPEHEAYLKAFSNSYHCKKDVNALVLLPDPVRDLANLGVGEDGEFSVGDLDTDRPSAAVIAFRATRVRASPSSDNEYELASTQPSTGQCCWQFEGDSIWCDQDDDLEEYADWLEYVIQKFLIPWGYVVNGMLVRQEDEGYEDLPPSFARLSVTDNVVRWQAGEVHFEDDSEEEGSEEEGSEEEGSEEGSEDEKDN